MVPMLKNMVSMLFNIYLCFLSVEIILSNSSCLCPRLCLTHVDARSARLLRISGGGPAYCARPCPDAGPSHAQPASALTALRRPHMRA